MFTSILHGLLTGFLFPIIPWFFFREPPLPNFFDADAEALRTDEGGVSGQVAESGVGGDAFPSVVFGKRMQVSAVVLLLGGRMARSRITGHARVRRETEGGLGWRIGAAVLSWGTGLMLMTDGNIVRDCAQPRIRRAPFSQLAHRSRREYHLSSHRDVVSAMCGLSQRSSVMRPHHVTPRHITSRSGAMVGSCIMHKSSFYALSLYMISIVHTSSRDVDLVFRG